MNGLGSIQRAILMLIDDGDADLYALEDLANGHHTRHIQDWLGQRPIQHTTRYTQLSAAPFKDFWR